MYNINNQNNKIYGAYGINYLNNGNAYPYTYDLSNYEKVEINYYPNINNNKIIKYQTPTKYLKPLIIQPSNSKTSYNYNYITRTPTPSPIKKSLIKDFNNVRLISKSPEPYLRLNTNNYYTGNYAYSYDYNNNNDNSSLANLGINNIRQVNKPYIPSKIEYYQVYEIKAKTPEPNLRRKKKLHKKHYKMKNNNYNTKTYIPLKQNEINNEYQLNNIYINYNNQNIVRYTDPVTSNLPSNNYYYQINKYPTKYIINEINPNVIYNNNKNIPQQNNNIRRNRFKEYNININTNEPNDNFDSDEFIFVNQIGEGSFGKIYCVKWIKNNKLYALKKINLKDLEELKEFQEKVRMVKNLYKNTNHYGFVKIFGEKVVPINSFRLSYNYYILMEMGQRDWEKEMQMRLLNQKYYSEYELYQIIYQLVKTLSLMQRNKVSHRDVKPQNVLIMQGIYKICDFGEARIIDGDGMIVQHVRGSQLFMSPILFYAYNHHISQVLHNSYKSDVFSLGMCALLAANLSGYILYDIRELVDIKAISNIINNKLKKRYSYNLINLILQMLQIDENKRMDFIQLEIYLLHYWNNNI